MRRYIRQKRCNTIKCLLTCNTLKFFSETLCNNQDNIKSRHDRKVQGTKKHTTEDISYGLKNIKRHKAPGENRIVT